MSFCTNIKISVVVPIYNSEKYLHKCIDSLLGQTYSNIEIVLVDDGSTDSSPKICDDYAMLDNRVKVIHQKNARIGAARNRGLDAVSGDYITFIDSDDFLELNAYEKCISLIAQYNPDIIQWDLTFVTQDDCKDIIPNRKNSEYIELILDRDSYLEKLFQWKDMDPRFNHIWTASHCVWSKMFKAELFEGVRFPLDKEYEDEMILHKVMFNSKKSVVINERFSNYLLRSSSTVHTMPLKGRLDKVDAFMDRCELMKATKSKRLIFGSTHDSLTAIFNSYLQAYEERDKDSIRKLIDYTRKLVTDVNLYINILDRIVAYIMLICPICFVMLYGNYRKMKRKYSEI